jgi:hypothetical protein
MRSSHRCFAVWPLAKRPVIELANSSSWDKSLLPEWRPIRLQVLAEAEAGTQDSSPTFT